MQAAGGGKNTEVTREDQENINSFGKLNNRLYEAQDELKARKKYLEELEDAGNELMLADEEECKYMMGEVFVHASNDKAEEWIEARTEELNSEVGALDAEVDGIRAEMAKLKTILYGKFGDSINLEES
eukprot:CAMPEP_0182914790 /NCGR_PEP_ID=MMETSP0034_2-20130328/38751_1 /TAXON_ID=156128 /ORGANISM="Nephroselmis pyriformis, Strain CCMP717" /LENGTH=127 /DNA_ID=CAMNT_0025051577 /DNA_START=479 /DNA_END=862 /DNA_ORIENTATION=-